MVYPQPQRAAEFPELKYWVEANRLTATDGLNRGTLLLASQEDYSYRGWISNKMQRDGWGMAVAMIDVPTLGLGELYLFPGSLYWAVGECTSVHRFRVWYGIDNHYVAHSELTTTAAGEHSAEDSKSH